MIVSSIFWWPLPVPIPFRYTWCLELCACMYKEVFICICLHWTCHFKAHSLSLKIFLELLIIVLTKICGSEIQVWPREAGHTCPYSHTSQSNTPPSSFPSSTVRRIFVHCWLPAIPSTISQTPGRGTALLLPECSLQVIGFQLLLTVSWVSLISWWSWKMERRELTG